MSVNWGGAASGAGSGALAGASFGPWGAAIGGVLGGALGLFSGGDTKKEKLKQIPNKSPEQNAFHSQLMQMLTEGGGFNAANEYDKSLLQGGAQGFQNFANPYNQQFEQKVLPGIAEKYAGAGALSSSGFGQAIGGAASDFQSQLAQLFTSLQGQAAGRQQQQYGNLAQLGLNYDPFAYYQQPGGATSQGGFAQGFDPSSLAGLGNMFNGTGWGGAGSGGGSAPTHQQLFPS